MRRRDSDGPARGRAGPPPRSVRPRVEVFLGDRDAAELGDRAGDLFLVAELSVEVEALLDQSLASRVSPCRNGKMKPCTRARARSSFGAVHGVLECCVEEAAALAQVALHDPPPARCAGEPHLELGLTSRSRPRQRRAEVGVLLVEDREQGELRIRAGEPRHRALLDPRQDVLAVAKAHGLGLARRLEQLGGVLADRLEHREARLARRPAQRTDEALVDERRERLEHVEPVLAADRLGRLERPAAREDGEPGEERALVLAQQAVAPLERRAQRPLPAREVLRAADEKVERPVETPAHRLRRQELRARRGQLDRERQPVEPRAHLGDRGGVLVVELEAPGRRRAARAAKRRTASFAASSSKLSSAPGLRALRAAGPAYSCSPASRSGVRLVASTSSRGAAASRRETSSTCGTSCSRLSSRSSMLRSRRLRREHVLHGLARLAHVRAPARARIRAVRRIVHRSEVDEDGAVAQLRRRAPRRRRSRAVSCPRRPGP